ncbi:hypothetical protein R3P38DRAFT_526198 [Favolaschia claudopus]|uniref:Uncharacterized protein n=1 Tax=Favolaschia claudopus TaxID=2862362 RepID=A0AAV9ZBB1_9AGAR
MSPPTSAALRRSEYYAEGGPRHGTHAPAWLAAFRTATTTEASPDRRLVLVRQYPPARIQRGYVSLHTSGSFHIRPASLTSVPNPSSSISLSWVHAEAGLPTRIVLTIVMVCAVVLVAAGVDEGDVPLCRCGCAGYILALRVLCRIHPAARTPSPFLRVLSPRRCHRRLTYSPRGSYSFIEAVDAHARAHMFFKPTDLGSPIAQRPRAPDPFPRQTAARQRRASPSNQRQPLPSR